MTCEQGSLPQIRVLSCRQWADGAHEVRIRLEGGDLRPDWQKANEQVGRPLAWCECAVVFDARRESATVSSYRGEVSQCVAAPVRRRATHAWTEYPRHPSRSRADRGRRGEVPEGDTMTRALTAYEREDVIPMDANAGEIAMGALLLAAERMDSHQARILIIRLQHDADAHAEPETKAFFAAYAAILLKRQERQER